MKAKRVLLSGVGLLASFVLWTILIMSVDVQNVGQQGTAVGFAAFNTWFHRLIGVHMRLYVITDWLGLVPLAVCMGFGVLGLTQLIRRRSLFKVDPDIIILGIYYIIVIAAYLIFEMIPINYRPFLKEDGMIAVTCPSWLTSVHPEEAEKFWTDAGSKLDLIEDNIKIMQDCGYQFVVAFALTEDCWTKNYFEPREQAINELIEKYNNCNTVKEYAELNRCEAELYRKYKQHYSYVFYIGRNTDNSNLRGGLL